MNDTLTKANLTDIPHVFNLYKRVIENMQKEGIDQWDRLYPNKKILLHDILYNEMYLFFENGMLVSAIVLNECQDEKYNEVNWKSNDGKIAVIHRLCVNPSMQHNGLGRKTTTLAEELLRKQGYNAIRLDTFSQNPHALKLYEGMGYNKVGEVTFRKGTFCCFEKPLILN